MRQRNTKKNIFASIWKLWSKRKRPVRDSIIVRKKRNKKFKKRTGKFISHLFQKCSFPLYRINVMYIGVGFFAIAIGAILLLFLGPFFNVKDIYITRWNANVNLDLAYEAIDGIRGKKIFTLEKKKITELLLKRQKSIQNIDISFIPPQSIDIQITSYDSVFHTYINDISYHILTNGSVIPSENTTLPYLHIYTDSELWGNMLNYKKILQEKYIAAIEVLRTKVQENIIELQIESLHYYVKERELIIVLQSWGELIFDLTKDLETQIEKLVIFHDEWWDIRKRSLIYTDLRIENKVFFCDTNEEFLCRLHLKTIYGIKQKNRTWEVPTSSN